MAREPRKIKVEAGSELAKLLTEAAEAPLLLEKNGELYRLARMNNEKEDIWEGYDPEKVSQAIKATAGTWADLDTDKLIKDIYSGREEGSRPATRP